MTGAADDRQQELAVAYAAVRPRLLRVAYAVLGSWAEAEDAVSECWLRMVVADAREPVRDVEGWGVVAVARAALDTLRSARSRRESYVGPWLPEPVVDRHPAADPAADPADRVTLDESIGYAMLVVLERLSPAERTSFVLHDVFGLPFAEVATAVGRTPDAVRQLASRARRRLRDAGPRHEVDPAAHAAVVERFLVASTGGDLDALVAVLDPAVEAVSDGGGKVSSALRPVQGADRVARFIAGLTAKAPDAEFSVVDVNGLMGVAVHRYGRPDAVISFAVTGDRVTRIHIVRNPDKLLRLE